MQTRPPLPRSQSDSSSSLHLSPTASQHQIPQIPSVLPKKRHSTFIRPADIAALSSYVGSVPERPPRNPARPTSRLRKQSATSRLGTATGTFEDVTPWELYSAPDYTDPPKRSSVSLGRHKSAPFPPLLLSILFSFLDTMLIFHGLLFYPGASFYVWVRNWQRRRSRPELRSCAYPTAQIHRQQSFQAQGFGRRSETSKSGCCPDSLTSTVYVAFARSPPFPYENEVSSCYAKHSTCCCFLIYSTASTFDSSPQTIHPAPS